MNRIEQYADKLRAQIKTGVKPDGTPMDDIADLERNLAIDVFEFAAYQDAKSRAQLRGLISTDEALTIYQALGGSPGANGGWAPTTDVAMKVTITTLMGQLMGVR